MTDISTEEQQLIDLIQTHYDTTGEWPRHVDIVQASPFGINLTERVLDDLLEKGRLTRTTGRRDDTSVEVYRPSVPSLDPDTLQMSEADLVAAVAKRGHLHVQPGHMLVRCPCLEEPAICGLTMMVHPDLEREPEIPVCTGPVFGREGVDEQAVRECPYRPDRLDDSESPGGWFVDP